MQSARRKRTMPQIRCGADTDRNHNVHGKPVRQFCAAESFRHIGFAPIVAASVSVMPLQTTEFEAGPARRNRRKSRGVESE